MVEALLLNVLKLGFAVHGCPSRALATSSLGAVEFGESSNNLSAFLSQGFGLWITCTLLSSTLNSAVVTNEMPLSLSLCLILPSLAARSADDVAFSSLDDKNSDRD